MLAMIFSVLLIVTVKWKEFILSFTPWELLRECHVNCLTRLIIGEVRSHSAIAKIDFICMTKMLNIVLYPSLTKSVERKRDALYSHKRIVCVYLQNIQVHNTHSHYLQMKLLSRWMFSRKRWIINVYNATKWWICIGMSMNRKK